MTYKSPIEIISKEFEMHIDDGVLKEVHKCGIAINKSELIHALSYDRDQYNKGFKDGYRTGLITGRYDHVNCKECVHWDSKYRFCVKHGLTPNGDSAFGEDGFCSLGERIIMKAP